MYLFETIFFPEHTSFRNGGSSKYDGFIYFDNIKLNKNNIWYRNCYQIFVIQYNLLSNLF